ncbi:MAG: hypothetical protein HY873_11270 [Chloroflexi bacterium]|nr:hypothetical protein [Chloroflexota bacterium]
MRKISLLGLLVLASISIWLSSGSVHAASVLTNGGFENGTYSPTGTPTGWSKSAYDPGTVTFTWDNATFHGGSKSVKITNSASNDARWTQTVNVQPHMHYVLSGWIKTQNVTGGAGANLGLYGTWDRSTGLYGTNNWTFVTFPFSSGTNSQVTIGARLGHWSATSTGTVWFDDLRLELGFLSNGGFEDGAGSMPVNWSTSAWTPSTATFTWDSSNFVEGTRSAKIAASGTNDAYWSQTIAVQPNTDYILSGWIKTQSVSGGAGASLGLFGRWEHSPGLFGTNTWTYVSFPFNSGADTQIQPAARIGHWGATSTGTVWFDDLRVDRPIDWKILVLIYGTTDFSYTDGSGSHRVIATMTQTEKNRAANAAGRFVNTGIPLLSSGYQRPQLTVRYPTQALGQLASTCTFAPNQSSVSANLDPAFDAVIVAWDDTGIDQYNGQSVDLHSCGGLAWWTGTSQTLSTFPVTSVSDTEENVFKHEWGHSILFHFAAKGASPSPAVDNHYIQQGQSIYRHCKTGANYVLSDDPSIPNSTYNNNSGFTHDYYSGITATPDLVNRCLGITPAAWSTGGPVTKP